MKKIIGICMVFMILFLTACESAEVTTSASTSSITATTTQTITTENSDYPSVVTEDITFEKWIYEDYSLEEYVVLDGDSDSYLITEPGIYVLTGQIAETVIIDVGDEDVQLVLNNVSIETDIDSAILVLSGDDITISAPAGTDNYLSDSAVYSDLYQDYNSAIFSDCDLVINGTGSISIEANYNNAIMTKDDLVIVQTTLDITSVDDGIIGKDSVSMEDVNITIACDGDGIHTTYESDDPTEVTDKGYMYIASGVYTITSGSDGIDATSDIIIEDGTFEILADSKGIKTDTNIYVNGGYIEIDAQDDGLNANVYIEISGGELVINSGDDGIKADQSLWINNGTIDIQTSYEGIESKNILISGGYINIKSSDDGINGSDPDIAIEDALPPNQVPDPTLSTAVIEITAGVILIDSGDDSVDSNGTIYLSGGILIINGPTVGSQSAVDYDLEWILTGGTVIAVSGYGNETPSTGSTQISLVYNTELTRSAGTTVSVQDEDGNWLFAFTPSKQYQAITITSSEFVSGDDYSIYLGGTVTGTLQNGYYLDPIVEDATLLETVSLTNLISTFNMTSTILGPPRR